MTATTVSEPAPEPAGAVPAYPPGFRFGVATAAYQIEGGVSDDGRGESIWDRFCTVPGAIANGDTGEHACDHYHRWRTDLDLMSAMRIESYRFSIAWPRVQPAGNGAVNERGVDFYRRLAEGLLERGIEPIATLYHWDLPQALQEAGGWSRRDTAARFADYVALMADRLGDVVTQWITHNEPWVVAFLGHAEGIKAPGTRDWHTALRVSHHLLLSHGLALRALRERCPQAEVGIALNLIPVYAQSDAAEDVEAASRVDGYHNRWFLDPLLRGAYPPDMLEHFERRFGPLRVIEEGDLEVIAEPIDFLGVNYYSPTRVRAGHARTPLKAETLDPEPPVTSMGWEIDPAGLREVLLRVHREYADIPLYITENGAAFDDVVLDDGSVDDHERVAYLEHHLAALSRAIADGADVRRYCLWSLLDNFEWEQGYEKRFGIVHVDFDTQSRVPKRSGLWYRDYIARVRDGL